MGIFGIRWAFRPKTLPLSDSGDNNQSLQRGVQTSIANFILFYKNGQLNDTLRAVLFNLGLQ